MKQDKNEIIRCPKCGGEEMQVGLERGRLDHLGVLVRDGTNQHMIQCTGCHHVFTYEEWLGGHVAQEELVE